MKRLLVSLVAFVIGGLLAAEAHAQAAGKWVALAPFPEPGEEVQGAAAHGKLYVFQGIKPVWRPMGLVYEYDPATNSWTKKKPMPRPSHHTAVTEMNGKIYLFGGFVLPESGPPSWVPIENAWEYDPATDSWRALAPLPTKRGAAAAAAAAGGKIYVIGGRLGAAFITGMPGTTDLVQEYTPATDSWATKAPIPTARSAVAFGVIQDKIYVAGGEIQTYEYLAAFRALEAYDPATNTWERLPRMPVPRHGLAGAAIGNRLHLVSGDVQSSIVPRPKGVEFHTELHDAFEFADR